MARVPMGHFARLRGDGGQEHRVDRLVASLASVQRLDGEVRRAARRLRLKRQAGVGDAAWVRHEDLRLRQRMRRQEAYFDVGWELGARAAAAAAAARVQGAAQLLEIARALVLGFELRPAARRGQRWQAGQK